MRKLVISGFTAAMAICILLSWWDSWSTLSGLMTGLCAFVGSLLLFIFWKE